MVYLNPIIMKQKKLLRFDSLNDIPIKIGNKVNSRFQVLNNALKTSVTTFLVVVTMISFQNLNAQIVSGAAVRANFGIDADVYANRLQFGGLAGAFGTDDWFVNLSNWNGPGLGVIDVTNATSLKSSIQNNNNFTFIKRMSVPYNTTIGTNIWIDAVYARDNNSTQGNSDLSVFSGNSNKNGDNPTSWSLGSGSTPQKNDIVDVFGYLRRDISPVALAQSATGILWGFGGATTISADGNSHNDFEFFRREVTYNGTTLVNAGPNAGHTAWVFEADGSISVPGDILVAIDFENGGTSPAASIRIWMSSADIANFNARPNRPFSLTGTFDQGNGAGIYGYAEITTKVPLGTPTVFAVVNVTAATLGAPWGSLEGPQGNYFDNIQALQFVEFGINLTALGLDSRSNEDGPCNNLLGSLLVKTRSSSSFTAELKDFAGPYLFGNITDVAVKANVSNDLTCEFASTTLTATEVLPATAQIKWYGPSPGPNDIGPELVGTAPVVTLPGEYTVRANAGPTGCFAEDKVSVVLNRPISIGGAGQNQTVCASNPTVTLDGSLSGGATSGTWTGGEGVFNPNRNTLNAQYTPTAAEISAGSVVLTLTPDPYGALVCTSTPANITITIDAARNAGTDGNTTICDSNVAVINLFDLITGEQAGGTWTRESGSGGTFDAAAGTFTPAAGATTSLFRYTLSGTSPCADDSSDASVTIYEEPVATAGGDQTVCNEDQVQLSGSISGGAVSAYWSTSGTGTFVPDIYALNATYIPSANDVTNGSVTLTLTAEVDKNSVCQMDTDDLVVTIDTCVYSDGCTIGYWKNFPNNWCSTYNSSTLYGAVFTSAPNNLANKTFMQILNLGGGGAANLARQSVAALLNICSTYVGYGEPYFNDAQLLINAVNAAFDSNGNAAGNLAIELDILNNAGCPIDAFGNFIVPADPIVEQTTASRIDGDIIASQLFTVYPIPFNNQISIRYNFKYQSNVTVEIFDYKGALVHKYEDKNASLNKEYVLSMDFARGAGQLYIVKMTTDREVSLQTIIKAKN